MGLSSMMENCSLISNDPDVVGIGAPNTVKRVVSPTAGRGPRVAVPVDDCSAISNTPDICATATPHTVKGIGCSAG